MVRIAPRRTAAATSHLCGCGDSGATSKEAAVAAVKIGSDSITGVRKCSEIYGEHESMSLAGAVRVRKRSSRCKLADAYSLRRNVGPGKRRKQHQAISVKQGQS